MKAGSRGSLPLSVSGLHSLAELPTQVQHEGHQGTSTWHLSHQSGNSPGVHGGLRGKEHVKARTHNLSSVPLPCNPTHVGLALGQSKH